MQSQNRMLHVIFALVIQQFDLHIRIVQNLTDIFDLTSDVVQEATTFAPMRESAMS